MLSDRLQLSENPSSIIITHRDVEETPFFSGGLDFEDMTIEKKCDVIAEKGKVSWKPSIAFLPHASKVKTKHKIEAIICDWARHQQSWSKIGEQEKAEICSYYTSLLIATSVEAVEKRKSWTSFGDILLKHQQSEVTQRFKELSADESEMHLASMEAFNLITFVNSISDTSRDNIRVLGLRVKEFKQDDKQTPSAVFSHISANWNEIQLRFTKWSEEDRTSY